MRPISFCMTGAALAAALWAAEVRAATSCSVESTAGVAFGTYNVFNWTPLDSAGSITFSCQDVDASDTVMIQLSHGSAPSFSPRYLKKGASTLWYNLYRDATRLVVWGDGTGGTSQYGPVTPPSGANVVVTIYGRVPALQNAPVGTYTDTITATILY
jgi:spore coat protein U-like protein